MIIMKIINNMIMEIIVTGKIMAIVPTFYHVLTRCQTLFQVFYMHDLSLHFGCSNSGMLNIGYLMLLNLYWYSSYPCSHWIQAD